MILSTSRKPSSKTRTLCKHLSRFLNCDYVNRGKRSFEDIFGIYPGVPVLLIGESHGNPGSFDIFDQFGNYKLSIYMNVYYPQNFKSVNRKKEIPVVSGGNDIAETIAKTLSFENMKYFEQSNPRCISVDKDSIDFMDSGGLLFSFRIKSYRVFNDGV
ncbi:rRNA maturation protein [Methanohalobium sp.]|uniref:rRNA maturation protein n=1 Tax=Methanohalobium sp. TaxID=2837493 RepID=UPI0025FF2178|nr:rRNA maturation protein [Methanohalobium sp.]